MESNAVDQPPKKPMHGALKFFLLLIAGAALTFIMLPCLVGVMTASTKAWTLKEQYALALTIFEVGSAAFFFLSVVVLCLKRWGLGGFLFGVSMALATAVAITEFMKLFDSPK
ncbi:MAG TPA: hypothetical protein VKX17_28015 [Planctomycetota bacterium]|nr:hypothetical protein [Planctomycetota bacterium]